MYNKSVKEILPKYKRISKFPDNTDKIIYIPLNKSGYGFNLINLEEHNVNIIDKTDFNNTIRNINKELDKVLIKKKIEEKKDFNKLSKNLINYMFIWGILLLLLVIIIFEVPSFSLVGFYLLLSIFVIIIIILIIVVYKLNTEKKVFKSKDKEIFDRLIELLKWENNYYKSKKLHWSTESKMFWLKLEKLNNN